MNQRLESPPLSDFVRIVEVGPRDGLQNEKTLLSAGDKVDFIQGLLNANLAEVEVTSFVRKESIPQLGDAEIVLEELKQRGCFDPHRLLALTPNLKGLERAYQSGVTRVAFFTSTSESFNRKNINATIDESFKRMEEMVKWAQEKKYKLRIRGYISTVFGCPYEGKIALDQVMKVAKRLWSIGCEELSIGDTIGVGTPRQVQEVIQALAQEFSLPQLAMHFHDTRAMALTNIYVSLEKGIRSFDSSAAGLGGCPYAKGASGNVATEDVIYLLHSLGMKTGVNLESLVRTSEKVLQRLGKESPSKFLKAKLAKA